MSRHGENRVTADGFPGYVRGWCCMAKHKSMQRGYRDVGYLLVARLRAFRPARCGVRAWRRQLALLDEHLKRNEKGAIRQWFRTHYPALMNLIPARRHGELIAGLIERAREETGLLGAASDRQAGGAG
jgi:hypothetical protein